MTQTLAAYAAPRETLYAAAERALREGATLAKLADPTEGAREGRTADEAAEIAAEDPGLVEVVARAPARARTQEARCRLTDYAAPAETLLAAAERAQAAGHALTWDLGWPQAGHNGRPLPAPGAALTAAEAEDLARSVDREGVWVVGASAPLAGLRARLARLEDSHPARVLVQREIGGPLSGSYRHGSYRPGADGGTVVVEIPGFFSRVQTVALRAVLPA